MGMEPMALGSLDVGDGVVWIFTSSGSGAKRIQKAAAAVSAKFVQNRKIRFVHATSNKYGKEEARIDFGIGVESFPAVGLLEIGEEEKDDKKFLVKLSVTSEAEAEEQMWNFVTSWQSRKLKPLAPHQLGSGEL